MNRRDFIKVTAAFGTTLAAHEAAPADRVPADIPLGINQALPVGEDLALINARLITLEPRQQSLEEAVLVRQGRIALIGSNDAVRAAAKDARIFDVGNRVVVPGFIDDHCHFEMTCNYASYQVDCHTPPCSRLQDVLDALRARARLTPPGRWVIGRGSFGWPAILSDKRMPTRQDLDNVTDQHPLVVMSGLHVAMFNTLGFKEVGLWEPRSRPLKAPGALVHRDAAGRPTGIATEVWPLLPDYTVDEVRASLRTHAKHSFLAKGITSVCNLPFSHADLQADQMEQSAGELPIRLRPYYHVPKVTSLDAIIESGLMSGVGNDMFRFGGVKIFIDGIGTDGLGHSLVDLKFTQDELNEFVFKAHEANVQLMMHVIRYEALQMGMNAVEVAQHRLPKNLRHRFEHAEPLHRVEDMQRIKRLRSMVTITPEQSFNTSHDLDPDAPRWRTMIQQGLEPIAITDSTGTIPTFSPLAGMASVMAPPSRGGSVAGEDSIGFEDALRTWTIWAAKGALEEQVKGSIAVGKLGDFAVLREDPRALSVERLFDAKVDATIMGGLVAFER